METAIKYIVLLKNFSFYFYFLYATMLSMKTNQSFLKVKTLKVYTLSKNDLCMLQKQ